MSTTIVHVVDHLITFIRPGCIVAVTCMIILGTINTRHMMRESRGIKDKSSSEEQIFDHKGLRPGDELDVTAAIVEAGILNKSIESLEFTQQFSESWEEPSTNLPEGKQSSQFMQGFIEDVTENVRDPSKDTTIRLRNKRATKAYIKLERDSSEPSEEMTIFPRTNPPRGKRAIRSFIKSEKMEEDSSEPSEEMTIFPRTNRPRGKRSTQQLISNFIHKIEKRSAKATVTKNDGKSETTNKKTTASNDDKSNNSGSEEESSSQSSEDDDIDSDGNAFARMGQKIRDIFGKHRNKPALSRLGFGLSIPMGVLGFLHLQPFSWNVLQKLVLFFMPLWKLLQIPSLTTV